MSGASATLDFGFPGDAGLGDRLLAAVLRGEKTATSSSAEGEGFVDAAHWRRDHVAFWERVADFIRADAGDPEWRLRDAEPVVVHRFRLHERE